MAKIEDDADRLSEETEANAAEAALQENEACLAAILDSTADGILAVDNSGRVLKANRRFAELWRIPDAVLESRDDESLLAFVLDQLSDPQAFLTKVQSLYGSDATDVGTVTFKDGRILARHSSATMQGSAVTGRVWSFSDITERSLAEKTLRLSESKFRSLVENIADVVIRYDLDLRFTYVSPTLSSWLDVQPADLLGKTNLEAGFADALTARFDDALRRALVTKLPVELEFAVPRLSGELFAQTRVFPELDAAGRVTSLVSVSRDMTAHRQAAEALRESEARFAALFNEAPLGYQSLDGDGRFLEVNAEWLAALGYSREEVIGTWFGEFLAAEYVEAFRERFPLFKERGAIHSEFEMIHKNGELRSIAFEGRIGHHPDGAFKQTHCILTDVTDRKRAEAALRESETKYRTVADNTYAWEWWVAPDGRYVYVSPSCERITGYSAEEFLEDPDLLVSIAHPDDAALVREHVSSGAATEDTEDCRIVFRIITAAGEERTLEHLSQDVTGEDGERLGRRGSNRDITEQVAAQHELLEHKRVLDTLMGNLPGMAFRCLNDAQWTMEFVSAGCEELTGYPPEALVGNAAVSFEDLMHPDDIAAERRETEAAIARGEPWTTIYRMITPAGDLIWVWERGSALKDAHGKVLALEGFLHEITSEHEAGVRLEAAAAEWRRTFDAMGDSVAVFDREGRVLRCNRATADLSGRPFDDIAGRPCFEVFHGTQDFHESCPQRRALVSGLPETSLIEQDGKWLRVTFEPQTDDTGSVCGGVHVVTDVTDLKLGEQRLQESIAKQERITKGVISALAQTLEVRDPYTAGHQRRVGELAAAIGRELGLSAATTRHLEITGTLHDVGKSVVPAELLAKPGQLSAMEFALIKGHSQAAYEILKSIEFDFPVADIVVQHHERLDGSGYPAALSGEQILPEARILAVADVVEAMISHRPYRAALPLDAALAELEDGAGSRYDAAACAAVTRLFREQAFVFSER